MTTATMTSLSDLALHALANALTDPATGLRCYAQVGALAAMPTQEAQLLLIACDGLWDFVPTAEACAVVSDALHGSDDHDATRLQRAACALVEAALDRGGTDNVSVLIVHIRTE